ncbi:hypothetical protein NMZ1139_27030 [Lactiplantibacillus plantarum]|nr:hypothetical protein NMZ1139_27030 [Lactiplantibacillus plantarum]
MNITAFWITWLVLSAVLQLYSNHQMNKQIKGDK